MHSDSGIPHSLDDTLVDLGFGNVSSQNLRSCSVDCVHCVDTSILSMLDAIAHESGAPINHVDVAAYNETKNPLPVVIKILKIVNSYDTPGGTIVPDHALALFAVHLSHNCNFQQQYTTQRINKTCFLLPRVAELYESYESQKRLMSEEELAMECRSYDANSEASVLPLGKDLILALFNAMWGKVRNSPQPGVVNHKAKIDSSNVSGMVSLFYNAVSYDPAHPNPQAVSGRENETRFRKWFNFAHTRSSLLRFSNDIGLSDLTNTTTDVCLGTQILPRKSNHYITNRRAVQFLNNKNITSLEAFCKLLLYVLTDGMVGPHDLLRLYSNTKAIVHTGMFITFASWACINCSQQLSARLDSSCTAHIGSMSEDIIDNLLVGHFVVPLLNPRPQPWKMTDEFVKRFGKERSDFISGWCTHAGQAVTIDNCARLDFLCFHDLPLYGNINEGMREQPNSHARMQSNADFVLSNLFVITSNEISSPLIPAADYLRTSADDAAQSYNRLKDTVLGVRHRTKSLALVNRVLSRLSRVCKLWYNVLKPYCIRLAIFDNSQKKDIGKRMSEVSRSTGLHRMPPLDTHCLDRQVHSRVHAVRKHVSITANGKFVFRMQSFPASIVLCNSTHVMLRLEATDGASEQTQRITCVHMPSRVQVVNAPSCPSTQRIKNVTYAKQALIKLAFSSSIDKHEHGTIISGMFFVHKESMLTFSWKPSATSHSFRHFSNQPLTPLRLLVFTGNTHDANDTVTTSTPFYVISRKCSQSAIQEAATKRQKTAPRFPVGGTPTSSAP